MGEKLIEQPALAVLGPPPSATGERPIEPIPAAPELDLTKVALGGKLFEDPQLSHGNQIACASCHTIFGK
jgi:cytochrome c peroxidase